MVAYYIGEQFVRAIYIYIYIFKYLREYLYKVIADLFFQVIKISDLTLDLIEKLLSLVE
jgi:hypothetical protein